MKNKKDFLQMDYSKLVDSKQNYIDEILNYLDIDEKNFEIISKKLERNNSKKINKLDAQLNLVKPRTLNKFKPISKEELLNDDVQNFYNQVMKEIK